MDIETVNLLDLPSVALTDRATLPNCSAIYFALSPDNTVLYIGKARNLAFRWRGKTHHRYFELAGMGNVRIAWLIVSDPMLLNGVEAACIAYFRPPLNGVRVLGEGDTIIVTIKLPRDLYEGVRQTAARERRSIAQQMVVMAEQGLRLMEADEPAAA
jgi:hypothetical protein